MLPEEILPPPKYSEEEKQVLAVLFYLGPPPDRAWISSLSLSKTLQEQFGILVHWRTVDALLGKASGKVARRRRNKRWEYSILAGGEDSLHSGGKRFIFVDPENALQKTMEFHSMLSSLAGTIRLCDPYLDPASIEHLSSCREDSEIRIISTNIRELSKIKRLISAAKTERRFINIRIVAPGIIHDRYIIDESRLYILGASINGFAKKQSMIVQAGDDIRAILLDAFEKNWVAGSVLP